MIKIKTFYFVFIILATFVVGILVASYVKPNTYLPLPDPNPFPQISPGQTFPPSDCVYNGITYQNGESFRAIDGCNTCGCNNGSISCTLIGCLENTTPLP